MKDNEGNELKAGDVCFYTERPHSNYADSLVEIYQHGKSLKVGTLVVNGLSGNEYQYHGIDKTNDLKLENYTWDYKHEPTGVAKDLQLIHGLSAEDVTVDLAAERFPLEL